jgi:methanogenic corrinoid protein MtbC1
MSQHDERVAEFLLRTGDAIAGFAAADVVEHRPREWDNFQGDEIRAWQAWIGGRVEELAAAISAGKPQLFAAHVRHAATHFTARHPSREVVDMAFRALRDVLDRELPTQARAVVDRYLAKAMPNVSEAPASLPPGTRQSEDEARLATSYLIALLEGDQQKAISLILDAAENGWSTTKLYLSVLGPAQRDLGQMWLADEINIADEHFATTTTKRVISMLHSREQLAVWNGRTVLAAAVVGNQHDVGLQIVANVFEAAGWRAISLGANVPIPDLINAVDVFQVDLLLLSAATTGHLKVLRDSILAVRKSASTNQIRILVGGAALTELTDPASEYGADGYAADAAQALRQAEAMLPPPSERFGPCPAETVKDESHSHSTSVGR